MKFQIMKSNADVTRLGLQVGNVVTPGQLESSSEFTMLTIVDIRKIGGNSKIILA